MSYFTLKTERRKPSYCASNGMTNGDRAANFSMWNMSEDSVLKLRDEASRWGLQQQFQQNTPTGCSADASFYGETSTTISTSPGDVGLEFTFTSFQDAVLKKPRLSWKPDHSTAQKHPTGDVCLSRLDAAGELLWCCLRWSFRGRMQRCRGGVSQGAFTTRHKFFFCFRYESSSSEECFKLIPRQMSDGILPSSFAANRQGCLCF